MNPEGTAAGVADCGAGECRRLTTRRRQLDSPRCQLTEPGGNIGNFSDTGNRLRAGPRMASNPTPDELRGGHFCGRRPAGPRLRLQSRPQPDDDLSIETERSWIHGALVSSSALTVFMWPLTATLSGGRSRPCGKEDDHLRRGADDPGHPGQSAAWQQGGIFNRPTDAWVSPVSGDLFVSDGYGNSARPPLRAGRRSRALMGRAG